MHEQARSDAARLTPREPISVTIAARVQEIVASAEQVAADMQRDVEASTLAQSADIRAAAEAEAERLVHEAQQLVGSWLDDSRKRIDEFTEDRIARLSALADTLIAQADALTQRFAAADAIRRQIHELIEGLGQTAETVARETSLDRPELARLRLSNPSFSRLSSGEPLPPLAEPRPRFAARQRPPFRAAPSRSVAAAARTSDPAPGAGDRIRRAARDAEDIAARERAKARSRG